MVFCLSCLKFYYRSITLFCFQTTALIAKNVYYSLHHFVLTFFQLFIPTILLLLVYVVKKNSTIGNSYTTEISYDNLPKDQVVFIQTVDDQDSVLIGTARKMAELSGYEFNEHVIYDKSNYTHCKKNHFCRYSNHGKFPPEMYQSKRKVLNTIILHITHHQHKPYVAFEILKNVSFAMANPFQISGGGPSLPLNDYSLHFEKLVYESLYYTQMGHDLHIKTNYEQFLQSRAEASGAVNSTIDLMIYCLVYICIFLCTVLIHFKVNSERNRNLIYGLTLNGMKESSYWCSWCVTETCMLFFGMHFMAIIGLSLGFEFFAKVNYIALFLILFTFALTSQACFMCCSTICYGMLCTVVNAFVLVILTTWFIQSFMVFVYSISGPLSLPVTFLLQVIPTVNFVKLFWDIKLQIQAKDYFAFVDLFSVEVWKPYEVVIPIVPPIVSILFQVLIALYLFFLTWYFDIICPSRYKSSRPFYFICSCKYWGCIEGNDRAQVDTVLHDAQKQGSVIPDLDSDIFLEHQNVLKSLRGGDTDQLVPLKIVKMSKTFTSLFSRRKSCIALTGVTLSAKRGTVLAVLGHNGAGKTTLINILNGTLPSSTGDAIVWGRSVHANIDHVRDMCGVCPQFDVIFDSLTVIQHLWLYASLKGIWINDKQIYEILDYLELRKLKHQNAINCSGGEKRRLTFASAVLGNPKMIFLDEPTSGLDPVRKRRVWNYVQKIKKGRVVVLTTHSMEEADKIGDKIAFLALGGVRAVGSSSHLKRRFGVGIKLDILLASPKFSMMFKNLIESLPDMEFSEGVLKPIVQTEEEKSGTGKVEKGQEEEEEETTITTSSPSLSSSLGKMKGSSSSSIIIRKKKWIKFQHEAGGLLTYSIPYDQKKSEKLKLFRFLESQKEVGIIKQFSVSPTTLEEVFMNVTHGNEELMNISKRGRQMNEMDESELKLSVVIEKEMEPFCTIEVSPDDTLRHIREYILRNYSEFLINPSTTSYDPDSISDEFYFLSSDRLTIMKNRERERYAKLYCPLIEIRTKWSQQQHDNDGDGGDASSGKTKSGFGVEERVWMRKLLEKDKVIRTQEKELEELKLILEELKERKMEGEMMMETDDDDDDENGENGEIFPDDDGDEYNVKKDEALLDLEEDEEMRDED